MWPAFKTGKWLTSRRPHVSRAFFFVAAEDGLRLPSKTGIQDWEVVDVLGGHMCLARSPCVAAEDGLRLPSNAGIQDWEVVDVLGGHMFLAPSSLSRPRTACDFPVMPQASQLRLESTDVSINNAGCLITAYGRDSPEGVLKVRIQSLLFRNK